MSQRRGTGRSPPGGAAGSCSLETLSRPQLLVLPARLLLKPRNTLEANPPRGPYLCTEFLKQQNSKSSNLLHFLSSVLGKVAVRTGMESQHQESDKNGDSGADVPQSSGQTSLDCAQLWHLVSAFPTSAHFILHQWQFLLLIPFFT